ncbi:hypothetical protein DCF38_10985 [Edwardsiella piscicida]|uniref:hypothetical protein n=1 Tax=Edwardsiella piscicida TaxID=1263550 RepID=UPI001057549D|nr:hypothetical protein [Edwardsiella piscicida]UCQ40061.1 hypothetical protein DCF38_10985 [Edwardsiella piscicida]
MIDRVFTLLSKIILVLIIIFLLIGIIDYAAIAIEYFKGERMELGNAADWVSAGANVVMALAAGYAALNAQTWLSGKRRNDAYNHAINIVTNLENVISVISKLNTKISYRIVKNNIRVIKQEYDHSTDLRNIRRDITNIKTQIDMCNRWGIEFKTSDIQLSVRKLTDILSVLRTKNRILIKSSLADSSYDYIKTPEVKDKLLKIRLRIRKPIDELFKFK